MAGYRILKFPGSGFYMPQKSRLPFIWRNLVRGTEGLKTYRQAQEAVKADVWDTFLGNKKVGNVVTVWEGHYSNLVATSDPRSPFPEGNKAQVIKS